MHCNLIKQNMNNHRKELQTQLWNIANTLRGKMGADEFRDYILGFIFYKYLSERMHLFADEILIHDGITFDQIDETTADGQEILQSIKENSVERLGYFLTPSELFSKLAAKGAAKNDNFILQELTAVLKHIEGSTMGHDSEEDFEGLFEDLDLGSAKLGKSENQKNELIAKVLVHLEQIDFRLDDTEADVLGDAYEYLIGQFASGAGKKAGEFYTPQEVSTILAKIVTTGKASLKSVYDPTCGSGSLLLRVAKEVEEVGGFYGQEMNPTTYNLARMNMILHGVHYQRFDLKNEDTLENPAPEHADLRFEAIVANPPFSAKWSASSIHENGERFSAYGKLAPKTKADFAFVQHMAHHLDSNATMACVLPHGALFRGGAERHIRRYLIEDCNWLDAVIGLPANIFYGTGIPTCILVLKKQRENSDNILFIDASQGFTKEGNQNYLNPEHIERIISTYRNRSGIEKFSHVAELSEVEENDYNLNIPRYVDSFRDEESIDIEEVLENISKLDAEIIENESLMEGLLLEVEARKIKQSAPPMRFRGFSEAWIKTTVGNELIESRTGGNYAGSSNQTDRALIKMGNLGRGCIKLNKIEYILDSESINPSDKIKEGDLLFNTRNTLDLVGKVAIWKSELPKAYYNSNLMRLTFECNNFMNYRLNSFETVKELRRLAIGTTSVAAIYASELAKIKISIPEVDEQRKISKLMNSIDKTIDQLDKKKVLLKEYKTALMQRMFI